MKYRIILETTPILCVSHQTVEEVDGSLIDYFEELKKSAYLTNHGHTHTYRIIHVEESLSKKEIIDKQKKCNHDYIKVSKMECSECGTEMMKSDMGPYIPILKKKGDDE